MIGHLLCHIFGRRRRRIDEIVRLRRELEQAALSRDELVEFDHLEWRLIRGTISSRTWIREARALLERSRS